MSKAKLTTEYALSVSPKAKPDVVWDTELTNFGLRVYPTGSRSWVAKYRAGGGGREAPVRWLKFGSPPEISAKDARAAAKKALAVVHLGGDPMGDRAAQRRAMTIEGLLKLYEEEGCVIQRGARMGAAMKPLTKKYTLARLHNHVLPLMGKRKVEEINPGDIEALGRAITQGKSAKDEKVGPRARVIVRGGDGAARKVIRDLSAVFGFAIRRGIIKENPVADARVRKTDNRRDRYLSVEEIRLLGEAMEKLRAEGANAKAINIALLWTLTGCRKSEVEGLTWAEVDLQRGMLFLEDSKTGASARPLGQAALSLLTSLREQAGKEDKFVFPAERGDGHYQSAAKVMRKAIKLAGLEGVSPHILRHTMGSVGASSGEGLLLLGSVLGHKNPRSTAIYAHVPHDPALLAAQRVSGPIAEALGLKFPSIADLEPS